jgi:predicted transcriptional regulator
MMPPRHAQALVDRRRDLNMTQDNLAAFIAKREPCRAGRVSQRTISNLETGELNPLDLSVRRFDNYLAALRWTLADFREFTGLQVRIDCG